MLKSVFLGSCAFSLTIIALVTVAEAQRSRVADNFVISARAGGVNFVEGDIKVIRADVTGEALKKGDNLGIGERVIVGQNGRAEVLLNPGSYVRLGSGAEFEFVSNSLDDLQIKLTKGTAIFEVFASNEFTVAIDTPGSSFVLKQSGVFQIDLDPFGKGTLAVYKGAVRLDGREELLVKSGYMASLGSETTSITKFDRDNRTEFAKWSRDRGKDLSKATSAFKNRGVRSSLLYSYNAGIWGSRGSYGLWVLDPLRRTFYFMPFGYGWRSPYGFNYRYNVYWYNLPPRMNPAVTTPVGTKNPSFRARTGVQTGKSDAAARNRIRVRQAPPSINDDIFKGSGSVFGSRPTSSEPAASRGSSSNGARPSPSRRTKP